MKVFPPMHCSLLSGIKVERKAQSRAPLGSRSSGRHSGAPCAVMRWGQHGPSGLRREGQPDAGIC